MKQVFKIFIVSIIIMTLTLVNFISVGVNLVTYAAEAIDSDLATNNKNIQFATYFTNEKGEKLKTTEESIQKEDLKLYVEIEVKKEGYFNGEITIDSSNFNLKSEKLSEGINKIEGNKITLNQINAGEKIQIELGIEPIRNDQFDLSLLNMQSKINLNGIYKNSSQKDIKIKATRRVELDLVSPFSNENEGIELSYEVITNKTSIYNNANKRIVQLLVKSGVNNNAYPIKQTKIEVNVPTIANSLPEQVLVSSKGTIATNGNSEYTLANDKWNYNQADKKVTIQVENEAKDNKITWNKTGKDEYILTFIYGDISEELNKEDIKVNSEITLYDVKSTTLKTNTITQSNSEEDISNLGNIVSVSSKEQEEDIYKGKIYSKIEREIISTAQLDVNLNNVAEEILVDEKTEMMIKNPINQEQLIGYENIEYKETTINKEQLIKLFGENFIIEITNSKNNEQIAQITKDTESNADGNIVITYPEGVQAITIKTSKPENMGKIEITNKKEIMATEKEMAKSASEVRTTIKGNFKTQTEEMQIKENTSTIKLEEPQTSAKLEVSRNNLSTVIENKGVEIKAILETNKELNDLYKNPQIKIELPEEVQEIKVNDIKMLYEDELKVENARQYDEDGKKIILITLTGEQTKYKDVAIQGTEIIINADIKLDRKATSNEKEIKLTYTNENATSFKNGQEQGEETVKAQIVSPKGLITVNNIEDLGIETIGDNEEQNVMLQKGIGEKTLKVETEIINNNDSGISNIAILGTFPTNGSKIDEKQSNIETKIASEISIENANAKVYYTENANATNELDNSSNQWKETIENKENVKKYLIVMDNIENAESVKASYDVTVPENLEYNKEAYVGYSVDYTNKTTGVKETAESTTIAAETGIGPQIETSLIATIGGEQVANDAQVKTGEVIQYHVTIKSTGSEDAQNVKIEAQIPEGTVYVKPEAGYEYTGASYYKEEEKQTHEIEVGTIKPGETVTKTYEVRVKQDTKAGTMLNSKANVYYGDAKQETNQVTNTVQSGNLRITVKRVTDRKATLIVGDTVKYFTIIENTSNTTQKNIKLHTNIPENTQPITLTKYEGVNRIETSSDTDDVKYEQLEPSEDVTIDNIEAGQNIILEYGLEITKMSDNFEFTANATDATNNVYRSNSTTSTIYNITLSAELVSNEDGKTLKTGDELTYKITVQNNSKVVAQGISINDEIPTQLDIKSITKDGKEVEIPDDNKVNIYTDIAANSTTEIDIKADVGYSPTRTQSEVIVNTAEITRHGEQINEVAEITNIIEAAETDTNGNGSGSGTTLNGGQIVSGTAWLDENSNGRKDIGEKLLAGIKVNLLNTETNSIIENTATTSDNGVYMINNVPEGNYIVVFDYDSSKYGVTTYQAEGLAESENSNAIARQLDIVGNQKTYGITDMIEISNENKSNINIGLIELQNFDLKLEKYVNKITVQTSAGTSSYSYDESTLAKVEIHSKQVSGSMVIIEYGIRVTNVGEVDSYASKIVDYMSNEFKFSSELNPDWYQSGEYIYNSSLANEKISAGESRTLTLVLTKQMTEDNTGLVNNTAEIAEQYNELGFEDKNSTPENKAQGENDMGAADVIISVGTGGATYVAIAMIVILACAGIGYFVFRIRRKTKENI